MGAPTPRQEGPRPEIAGGVLHRTYNYDGRRVINKTGVAIAADKLVTISGFDTTSGLPKVVLADADAGNLFDAYVALASIADGAESYIYRGGESTANLDTNSASLVGDPVYLSATAGAFTHTAPATTGSAVVPVGWVLVKSASVGQIFWDCKAALKFGSHEFQTAVVGNAIDAATITATGAGSTIEVPLLASVVAGTVTASKALVVDANKAVDTARATTDRNLGGTGVPGGAAVATEIVKAMTAFSDTTAKDVFTVTVPNAAHAAMILVDCLGVLGAGGAIGAGESTMSTRYYVTLARTASKNVVVGVSSVVGAANAKVAGADDITSVVVTASSITGSTSQSNTFTLKVAITRSGAGATNHTGVFRATVINQNATGVTIA